VTFRTHSELRTSCWRATPDRVLDCSHHAPRDAARLWRAGLSSIPQSTIDLYIEERTARKRAGITRSVMTTIPDIARSVMTSIFQLTGIGSA
jgi:hypothetical protein